MSIQNKNISGLWYVAIMEQQKAFLVLGVNDFNDVNNIKKTFANNKLNIPDTSSIENIKIISENREYNTPIREKVLVKTDYFYEGLGTLGILEHNNNSPYRISTIIAEELLKANSEEGCVLNASLYIITYRNSTDRDVNSFHQTAVLAKDEIDVRNFIYDKHTWFSQNYTTLEKIMSNSNLNLRHEVIILPNTLVEYQRQNQRR